MQPALIVLLCVGAAILYGVAHDQITARVCVEYFTVGHPPVFDTTDPTLLGLGWGIIATWWAGLILGLAAAVAARAGRRPPRSARSLVPQVVLLLAMMAVAAVGAGAVGNMLGRGGAVTLNGDVAGKVPPEKHAAFLACLFAHSASYLVGFAGGGMQVAIVWISRKRR